MQSLFLINSQSLRHKLLKSHKVKFLISGKVTVPNEVLFIQDAAKPKAVSQNPVKKLSEDEQRRRKSISEDLSEPRKVLDKNRTHSFILDLELGTEEALRQRGGGKNERYARREKERKENEKERGVSDDRVRYRPKLESKKGGEAAAEEKEGGVMKCIVDDKVEKKGSKVKGDKKSSMSAREGRLSVTEGSAPEEGTTKDLKKDKTPSETLKEKVKGEKSLGRADPKQHHRLDSTGSVEERAEAEAASDVNRKKDKQAKEILKRSKGHQEGKSLEKLKVRQDVKDVGAGGKDKSSTSEPPKQSLDTKVKNSEAGPKVKHVSEKTRFKSTDDLKSQSQLVTKTDKKAQGQEARGKTGMAPSKPESSKKKEGVIKDERRVSEDRGEKGKDVKSIKKTSDKKTKESEKKIGDGEKEGRIPEADDLSSSSSAPSAVAEEVQSGDGVASQPLNTHASESRLTTQQDSDSIGESDLKTPQVLDSAAESGSTDQSISESIKKSDLTSDSQAMDTESDLAASRSTDTESSCTSMDTESESTASQAMDTESDITPPQASVTKSELESPHVFPAPAESSETEQSQPAETDLAGTSPPQSSELISVSDLAASQSSDLHQWSNLMHPNSLESKFTGPETSGLQPNTDLTLPQSSDSIPAQICTVPESSDFIPESDPTVAQPSNSVPASEFAVCQDSDTLPDPVTAGANSTVPDDMYDALSDITPDPDDEEEATMRLAESQPQPRPIPAEADALLSLMDVCASAAVSNSVGVSGQEAESSFQDADIKMKEAALTLLSMDPDQAVLPSFIAGDGRASGQQVESVASYQVDVTSATEPPKEVTDESESESSVRDSEEGDKHTEGSAPLFTHLCSNKKKKLWHYLEHSQLLDISSG